MRRRWTYVAVDRRNGKVLNAAAERPRYFTRRGAVKGAAHAGDQLYALIGTEAYIDYVVDRV